MRNNPGVRWAIIFVLIFAILLEGIAIGNRLLVSNAGGELVEEGGSANDPSLSPTPAPQQQLACRVVGEDGVNVRTGPSTDFARIDILSPNASITAIGKNGEVPWLLIQLEDGREGWVSSKASPTRFLVECEGDPFTLPETGPATSAADEPEEQSTATLAPTVTPQPTLTAAPNVRLREGNGPDLHAAPRTFDITIDGDLGEWGTTSAAPISNPVFMRENWTGPQDASGVVRAAWDEQFLYLAVQVNDDIIVQESKEDLLHRGDAVEFFWDADLFNDFEADFYNEDDSQAIVSPGNFIDRPPSSWVYRSPHGNFNAEIEVAAQPTEIGYNIEARLPWARLNVIPTERPVYGYAIAISDNDTPGTATQESQISTSPEAPFQHPLRWGNFILDR